jgi:hypothetical protein
MANGNSETEITKNNKGLNNNEYLPANT